MAAGKEIVSVGVMTTVFPGVEPYFSDFLSSMAAQTHGDFVLFVVNDGMSGLGEALSSFPDLDVREVPAGETPAVNRMAGIDACRTAGVDVTVFADSDDCFAPNRIEKSCELLAAGAADVVVNDVHLADEGCRVLEANYFSSRLAPGQVIELADIRHSNVLGLSNTAVRSTVLTGIKIESDVNVVDWLLYTRLLMRGAKAVFTNETSTSYRQHASNFVGFGAFDPDRVRAGVLVKGQHYGKLAQEDASFGELEDFFVKKMMEFDDADAMQSYLAACKERMPSKPFWWEEAFYIR